MNVIRRLFALTALMAGLILVSVSAPALAATSANPFCTDTGGCAAAGPGKCWTAWFSCVPASGYNCGCMTSVTPGIACSCYLY